MPKLNPGIKSEYVNDMASFDSGQQTRSQEFFDEDRSVYSNPDASGSKVEKLWNDWELFFGLCGETKLPENSLHKMRSNSFLEEVCLVSFIHIRYFFCFDFTAFCLPCLGK